MVLRIPDRRSP